MVLRPLVLESGLLLDRGLVRKLLQLLLHFCQLLLIFIHFGVLDGNVEGLLVHARRLDVVAEVWVNERPLGLVLLD